jgi:hypothetical protein
VPRALEKTSSEVEEWGGVPDAVRATYDPVGVTSTVTDCFILVTARQEV